MAKRETMGQRIKRAREELGLTILDLQDKINLELRAEIGETTLRQLERDQTPNPGIKTIELVARGLGLSPLDLMALGLDEALEEAAQKIDRNFAKTRFNRLLQAYRDTSPRVRLLIDDVVQMLIDRAKSR